MYVLVTTSDGRINKSQKCHTTSKNIWKANLVFRACRRYIALRATKTQKHIRDQGWHNIENIH